MKKENIKSDELKNVIAIKTGNFDFEEVSEEDINDINEIILRAKKLSGESTDIDLDEISSLESLKKLGLIGFDLSNDDIGVLSSLKLNAFEFDSCKIFGKLEASNEIDSLTINGGEIVDFIPSFSPKMLIISETDVDFSKFDMSKTSKIFMRNCTVRNVGNLNSLSALEYINFDGSKVFDTNGNELTTLVAENIEVSFEEEFIKADIEI